MPIQVPINFWKPPKWIVILCATLLLSLIAYTDYATPSDVSMALFYMLPVAMTIWFVGRRAAYLMAVLSVTTWLFAEVRSQTYQNVAYAYGNAITRLAFFLFSVPVLSAWRTMGERLGKMVEERTAELRAEVAERQRAEHALRELAAQLSAAEDAERRRVAYDLHDGLGQMLSLLKMNLEASVSKVGSAGAGDRLSDAVRMVDSLIKQTRSLTFDLHPSMLDDLGLVATLHGYARDFGTRVGIDVTVTEHGVGRVLPTTMAHYIFRAVKELLNNAARHGKAKEIVVAVHWETGRLRVVIDDDGGGFDPSELPRRQGPRGLGLAGISERMHSLGGAIHLESSPGQGARVILEGPLEAGLPAARVSQPSAEPAVAVKAESSGAAVSSLLTPAGNAG